MRTPCLSLPTSASTEKKTLEGREVGLLIDLVREVIVETEMRVMRDLLGLGTWRRPSSTSRGRSSSILRKEVMFASEWLDREGLCPESRQRL